MKKLKQVRDQAGQQVLKGENAPAAFHDYDSLNRKLDERKKTVVRFKKLANEQPELAKTLVSVAMESLLAAKEYKLIADHVDFKLEAKRIKMKYQQLKQAMPNRRLPFVDNEMLGLLKVMTETGQKKLASEVGSEFKKVNTDQIFHDKVDKLLGDNSAL